MGAKPKGRPPIESPKNIQVKFRADKKMVEDIEYCCEKLNITKSDVLRIGVEKVKSEIMKSE